MKSAAFFLRSTFAASLLLLAARNGFSATSTQLTVDPTRAGIRDAAHAIIAAPGGGVFVGGEGKAMVSRIGLDGVAALAREMGQSSSPALALATGPDDGSLIASGADFVSKASPTGEISNRAQMPFLIRGMVAGTDGSVYVAGDHRVRKLDPNLRLVWDSTTPTPEADAIQTIGVDRTDAVYVGGPGFLSRLSPDGGQWLSRLPLDRCNASAMAVDNTGNVYIAGSTPTPAFLSSEFPKACVAKISLDGAGIAWSAAIAGTGSDRVNAIALEPGGAVVIAGSSSALKGGQGFAARLDADGKVLDTVDAGRGRQSQLEGIAVDSDGQTWVAGWSDDGVRQPVVTRIDWNATRNVVRDAVKPAGGEVCVQNATVTSTADGGPGTLRDAVLKACTGAIINFSLPNPSTITLTSGSIQVLVPVAILGPGAAALTISGGGHSRIFFVHLQTLSQVFAIDGVTLANGLAKGGNGVGGGGGGLGSGGAILISPGYTSVTNAVLQNNSALGGNGSLSDSGNAGGGGGGMGGDGLHGANANVNLDYRSLIN